MDAGVNLFALLFAVCYTLRLQGGMMKPNYDTEHWPKPVTAVDIAKDLVLALTGAATIVWVLTYFMGVWG